MTVCGVCPTLELNFNLKHSFRFKSECSCVLWWWNAICHMVYAGDHSGLCGLILLSKGLGAGCLVTTAVMLRGDDSLK